MIEKEIKELDALVKKMEGEQLPLEEALGLFQKGVDLVKKCSKALDEAELKVKEIIETQPGVFKEVEVDASSRKGE
jgi:exodeoxyribonuclease VII small subunit